MTLVIAAVRFRAYYLGLFVLLPVVLALAIDVTVIYTPAGSLVPALDSYWLAIHVTAMIVASGQSTWRWTMNTTTATPLMHEFSTLFSPFIT